MESGAGRADRDAEHVGDLGQREAVVVLEDEDRPLVGRQTTEPALELVAVGDPAELVRSACGDAVRVCVVGEEPDDRSAPSLAASLGDACADDDAVVSGLEPVGVAQPRQLVPDGHERLLQGVLGETVVAQDPVRDGEQPPGRQPSQGLEGLLIAGRRL